MVFDVYVHNVCVRVSIPDSVKLKRFGLGCERGLKIKLHV